MSIHYNLPPSGHFLGYNRCMKTTIVLIALIASSPLFAAPVKTCNAVLRMPDSPAIPTTVEISDNNGTLEAITTQKVDGQSVSTTDSATLFEETVRANLSKDSDPDDLNHAESLVVHAMLMESDPVFQGTFKSGIALKKVRSAKVYVVGESTNMGNMSVVEAKDEKGKTLGSFIGGFLVAPCR